MLPLGEPEFYSIKSKLDCVRPNNVFNKLVAKGILEFNLLKNFFEQVVSVVDFREFVPNSCHYNLPSLHSVVTVFCGHHIF